MRISASLLLILLTACQVFSYPAQSNPPSVVDKRAASGEQWTRHNEGEVSLSIVVPRGWETYNTSVGIVLNEYIGGNAPDTPLNGFLIHIFIPHDKHFTLPDSDDVNMAWFVLNQVVTNPDYIGGALVSEPVAFEWDDYDAAYYLLNNRDQTVTMLLALALPDQNLVVAHVSVPEAQAARIRALLPDLLGTLTVDGHHLNAAALSALPDPLVFPSSD
ncbi:MAG: hypothetical protein K8J31_16290 [Anaerolineae bacterium]|nr:hypothetical protein [Anaerolineae bacterium]